jgi:hypothetical protein
MKRGIVLGACVAVLVGSPAWTAAFPIGIPFDPFKYQLLGKIAKSAVDIYRSVESILAHAQELKERAETMFPDETLAEIGSVFQQVRSLQEEVEQLACNWRFSEPFRELRQGLLRPGLLCKSAYQRAFGRPVRGIDRDLEEYLQWSAARRLNTVAGTIAVSQQWNQAGADLAQTARRFGTSAGEAERLAAIASAMGLQQATLANKQAAEMLSGIQEDLDMERHEDWTERVIATRWVAWMVNGQSAVRRGGWSAIAHGGQL